MTEMPIWVPLVSALAGGVLVGLINLVMNWQNRKVEERRHLRELMFNAALENWKQNSNVSLELSKRGNTIEVLPLESYIIHLMKISDVLLDAKINKHNISQKLKEIYEIGDAATKFISEYDQQRRDRT